MADVRTSQGSVLVVAKSAPSLQVTQVSAHVVFRAPTEEIRTSYSETRVTAKFQLSLRSSQAHVHVVVLRGIGSRKLRAWTFTQDDHDFYVLHLGDERTLVFDLTTSQWATWKSNGRNVWRAGRGIRWDLVNVGGDDTLGILWNVDATARDDDATSGLIADRVPIRSVMRGLYPMRLRDALSCARAVLTVSQADPVKAGVGITLKTSDDFGQTWLDHGEKILDVAGRQYDISWPSIGLITAPGKIFEIIDTGYARRIDALDVDLGEGEEQGSKPLNG